MWGAVVFAAGLVVGVVFGRWWAVPLVLVASAGILGVGVLIDPGHSTLEPGVQHWLEFIAISLMSVLAAVGASAGWLMRRALTHRELDERRSSLRQ